MPLKSHVAHQEIHWRHSDTDQHHRETHSAKANVSNVTDMSSRLCHGYYRALIYRLWPINDFTGSHGMTRNKVFVCAMMQEFGLENNSLQSESRNCMRAHKNNYRAENHACRAERVWKNHLVFRWRLLWLTSGSICHELVHQSPRVWLL